jgi:hypothetical protein
MPGNSGARSAKIGHQNSQRRNPRADSASTQGREILFHSLATQHLQRVRIIELLAEINRKLDILIEIAMRRGGGLP